MDERQGSQTVKVLDPGAPSAWPSDVAGFVDDLARRVQTIPGNQPDKPSNELQIGTPDDGADAEAEFRTLLGDRPVAIYHATRLLPHEIGAIAIEGLVPLTVDHRAHRLDRVIQIYGADVNAPDLEGLRHCWPMNDPGQLEARVGGLWGVSPMAAAFAADLDGLSPLLDDWGGESFSSAGHTSRTLADVVRWLTARSTPAVVEAGVVATSISTHQRLWPVFAAHHLGWNSAYHEYCSKEPVSPERLTILTPTSNRWPLPT